MPGVVSANDVGHVSKACAANQARRNGRAVSARTKYDGGPGWIESLNPITQSRHGKEVPPGIDPSSVSLGLRTSTICKSEMVRPPFFEGSDRERGADPGDFGVLLEHLVRFST